MPEARQNSSKLAEMFDRASSFNALVGMAVDVVSLFMALLSSVESAPRAYRLKASNAASPFSTSIGTIPTITGCRSFQPHIIRIEQAASARVRGSRVTGSRGGTAVDPKIANGRRSSIENKPRGEECQAFEREA